MNAIRFYRSGAGLTQVELAQKCEVSSDSVRRWESNLREPRASDIKKLCEVLCVTEAELLNGPASNEIRINILWEVDDMHVVDIRDNEFNIGFHGNRDIGWFSVPDDVDPEEFGRRVVNELKAAKAAREARANALKQLNMR